jgi:hypothetical protein
MPGHVLHLCNLYCHCPSQPLPFLLFSVHISHSITRFPAPSPTSPTDSHKLSLLCCAHFGTVAASTWGVNAFNSSDCPSGGAVGSASFGTFQRAQKHSNPTIFFFFLLHVTRAASENSSRACTDNKINSVPKLYSLDLSTFRAALLYSYPQRC